MPKSLILIVTELSARVGFGHKGVKVIPEESIALQIDVPDDYVVGESDDKTVFSENGIRFILANLQAHLATEDEVSDF